jgi:hypothetical protein
MSHVKPPFPVAGALAASLLLLGWAAAATADDGCQSVATMEASALPLVLDLDTTGEPDHAASLCPSQPGAPDLVYELTLDRAFDLDISAHPAPSFDVLLYLRAQDCDDPLAQLICSDVVGPGGVEGFRVSLSPGSYYIYVDGQTPGDYGPVSVHISTILPVTGSTWGAVKGLYNVR